MINKHLTKHLKAIVDNATPPSHPMMLDGKTKYIFNDGVAFQLCDVALTEYRQFVAAVLKNKEWGAKYSEKYINKQLNNIISKCLVNPSDIEYYIAEFITELNTSAVEQTVYIPLDGFSLTIPDLTIGNVLLFNVTTEKKESLTDAVYKIIGSMKHSETEKEGFENFINNDIEKNYCKVFAKYRVIAEPERAKERAIEETGRVLDILWYGSIALYSPYHRIDIGILGNVPNRNRWTAVISNKGYHVGETGAGIRFPFDLNPHNIEELKNIGVFELSEILQKDRPTNYEENILRATHWLSSSRSQIEPENCFLCGIIALEVLFTPKDGSPIINAISEAVAILLGDKVDQRKIIKRRIKELYAMRSAISHGGSKSILNADLNELILIVGTLINMLLKRRCKFQNRDQLLDWFEDQRLSVR
jgi:hypothetical protein